MSTTAIALAADYAKLHELVETSDDLTPEMIATRWRELKERWATNWTPPLSTFAISRGKPTRWRRKSNA